MASSAEVAEVHVERHAPVGARVVVGVVPGTTVVSGFVGSIVCAPAPGDDSHITATNASGVSARTQRERTPERATGTAHGTGHVTAGP